MRRSRLVSGETTLARMWVLSAVATVLGLVGGFAAVGLFALISLFTHLTLLGDVGFDLPTLRDYQPTLWLIPITVGGGLIVSALATWSPVIRGHGIPESLEAILDRDSRIKPRAAIAKPLSAAITIGTGGPFGAEGPIIVTGGSIGSLIGQLLSVSAAERKIMLATGAAAGMSATFNTPIAAVILAIELVLFERSLRVIVPLSIASGIAAAIHVDMLGGEPLFAIQAVLHVPLSHLPLFALVGVASGLMAIVLNKGLFAMEAAFRRLPINIFWWPAIGALGFALIGLAVPRTLSMGYSAIIDTLNGHFTTMALAVLLVAKLLSWLIALGSQTSGGTLAPMFLVGATMGCLLGNAVNVIFPAWHVSPSAFALVAMGATFGAATKAVFAAVVFAAEVTGEYTAIVPLLIGAAVAELIVEGVLSDRLMTEKLSHRGFRVEFRTAVDTLRTRVARQVMRDAVWLPITASPARAGQELAAHGLSEIPVVDRDGQFCGMVAASALADAGVGESGGPGGGDSATLEDFVISMDPIAPDEYLAAALERLLTDRVDALPVVAEGSIVGIVSHDDIDAERYRRGAAQEVRQSGWLASARRPWRRPGNLAATAISSEIVIPAFVQNEPPEPVVTHAALSTATAQTTPVHEPGPTDPVAQSTSNDLVVARTHSRAAGARGRRPAHDRLLPDPVQLTPGLGQFCLSERSRIVVAWDSAEARPVAERLAEELRAATGLRLRVSDGRAYRDDISFRLGDAAELPAGQGGEGYVLTAGVTGVTVVAPTAHGLHNGAQTIRQLLPVWASAPTLAPGPWTIPAVVIVDYPRNRSRGLSLDMSACLLSPQSVAAIVDRISAYKLNRLQLVLSQAQADRLAAAGEGTSETWASPPDTDPAGTRPGGYWTALELRRLAAFGAARWVTVTTQTVSTAARPGLFALADVPAAIADMFAAAGADASASRTPGEVMARVPMVDEHGLSAIQQAAFPHVLAVAEAGWSPRSAFQGGERVREDFLARLATQAPRLALHGTAFDADPAVPWRLHMMTAANSVHRRTFDGPFALLIAPGFGASDLAATIDWGDGTTSEATVVVDTDPGRVPYRYTVMAHHEFARAGTFRAAITVTAPETAAARSSMVLRVGATGRMRRAAGSGPSASARRLRRMPWRSSAGRTTSDRTPAPTAAP